MVDVSMFDIKIEATVVRHLESETVNCYCLRIYDEEGNQVVLFFDTKDQISEFAGRIFEQLKNVK